MHFFSFGRRHTGAPSPSYTRELTEAEVDKITTDVTNALIKAGALEKLNYARERMLEAKVLEKEIKVLGEDALQLRNQADQLAAEAEQLATESQQLAAESKALDEESIRQANEAKAMRENAEKGLAEAERKIRKSTIIAFARIFGEQKLTGATANEFGSYLPKNAITFEQKEDGKFYSKMHSTEPVINYFLTHSVAGKLDFSAIEIDDISPLIKALKEQPPCDRIRELVFKQSDREKFETALAEAKAARPLSAPLNVEYIS